MPHSTPHFPVTLLVTLSKGHHLPLHIYQNCSYKSHAVNEMSIKLANHLSIKTVEVTQHLSMHVNIRNIHPGSKTSSALTIWCGVFSVLAWALSVPIRKMRPYATSCLHGYKLTVIWVSPPTPMWTCWQFLETYSVTSDGSGWRKAVVNWCLKFDHESICLSQQRQL